MAGVRYFVFKLLHLPRAGGGEGEGRVNWFWGFSKVIRHVATMVPMGECYEAPKGLCAWAIVLTLRVTCCFFSSLRFSFFDSEEFKTGYPPLGKHHYLLFIDVMKLGRGILLLIM